MPRMNNETKLLFAIEHILHLEDLIEGNEWETHLQRSLSLAFSNALSMSMVNSSLIRTYLQTLVT